MRGMGSKVAPYFILTAEKVTNPKELDPLTEEKGDSFFHSPPFTPTPSGATPGPIDGYGNNRKTKTTNKCRPRYKISVKELKRQETTSRKMELIKEKLERSRARFNEQKARQNGVDINCEPTVIGLSETGDAPKLERSMTDIDYNSKTKKKAEGSFPYVYFVVSEDKETDKDNVITMENGEKIKSKSADKRRRVRIVEENRLKRDKKDKQNQVAKMQGIARELGLKSSIDAQKTPENSNSPTRPAINQIVFPGQANVDQGQMRANVHRIHSPPRIPPGTPATTVLSGLKNEHSTSTVDTDDNVPRKPFLSSPLYAGKIRSNHHGVSSSMPIFELPAISADQRRRALGFGSLSQFEDFSHSSKPKSEQRQRRVHFADSLPMIRGSGFLGADLKHFLKLDAGPSMGPRAVTMGSITLPSEKMDKQSMCQKFLLGENMSTARTKKFGTPLPLPKIDIVSNVYDEMIIKMIQEYLQDSNTPMRQSQLAKELLVHLQKHNDTMSEMNVPNLNKKPKKEIRPKMDKAGVKKHQLITQNKCEANFYPPPNTAEELSALNKVDVPIVNAIPEIVEESSPTLKSADNVRNIPYVQITFKNKDNEEETHPEIGDGLNTILPPKTPEAPRSGKRESREKTEFCSVAPVSFQMAPPGLSKEDSIVETY